MKPTKATLMLILVTTAVFFIAAYNITSKDADFHREIIHSGKIIDLSEISTSNRQQGMFKATVNIKFDKTDRNPRTFHGMEIGISDNPNVDKILIGITNNLISRIELIKNNDIIETKELGFVGKMSWSKIHTLSMDFYEQTCSKYRGKSKIHMRMYNDSGFWGDIATIHLDLTKYGDLSQGKTIGVFSKSLEGEHFKHPRFEHLKIWKNHNSID